MDMLFSYLEIIDLYNTGNMGTKREILIFLTHCRLYELTHTMYWMSPISILGMSDYEI